MRSEELTRKRSDNVLYDSLDSSDGSEVDFKSIKHDLRVLSRKSVEGDIIKSELSDNLANMLDWTEKKVVDTDEFKKALVNALDLLQKDRLSQIDVQEVLSSLRHVGAEAFPSIDEALNSIKCKTGNSDLDKLISDMSETIKTCRRNPEAKWWLTLWDKYTDGAPYPSEIIVKDTLDEELLTFLNKSIKEDSHDGEKILYTPIQYPGGEPVTVYIKVYDDRLTVSDRGGVNMSCTGSDEVFFLDSKISNRITSSLGVSFSNGKVFKEIRNIKLLVVACWQVAQASAHIAMIATYSIKDVSIKNSL